MTLSVNQVSYGSLVMGAGTAWHIESIDGLGWGDVRTSDVDKVLDHGVHIGVDLLGARTIEMTVHGDATGHNMSGATTLMAALSAAWQPEPDRSILTPLHIRLGGWASDRLLFGHPRRLNIDSEALVYGRVTAHLQFVAPDPRFYSEAEEVIGFAVASPTSVENQGAFPTLFSLEVPGAFSGPGALIKVHNDTTGEMNGIGNFEAASGITFDWHARRIFAAEASFIRSRGAGAIVDPTWWQLRPGIQTVRVESSAGAPVTLSYRHAWLG